MMKKRIIIFIILLMSVGCTQKQPAEPIEKEDVAITQTENTQEEGKDEEEAKEPQKTETDEPKENTSNETSLSREEYIIQTFADNGKTVDSSMWILEEQGPNKVAVIIKEGVGKGRPTISKLIFLWYGDSSSAEILFMMVNNNPLIGSDN